MLTVERMQKQKSSLATLVVQNYAMPWIERSANNILLQTQSVTSLHPRPVLRATLQHPPLFRWLPRAIRPRRRKWTSAAL